MRVETPRESFESEMGSVGSVGLAREAFGCEMGPVLSSLLT